MSHPERDQTESDALLKKASEIAHQVEDLIASSALDIVGTQIDALACPLCEARASSRWQSHSFEYLDGAKTVLLSADVPVYTCEECSYEFLDWRAEVAKHEAVCRYLCVLTPAEIKSGRKRHYEANRAMYAKLTGIGEASIARYESGSQIQTRAIDRLMRLSFDPHNVRALLKLSRLDPQSRVETRRRAVTRALENPDQVRASASLFALTITRSITVPAA
ncbi:MAG TPA: hypothetical protein VGE27_04315 [Gemmatimonas sp.]|uniref:hypothetical protein n=1 Tax=Gemmatimonas sp. TaxID=1962908 RepID=UPI002EDA3419